MFIAKTNKRRLKSPNGCRWEYKNWLQNFLSPTEHHAGSAVGTHLSSICSNAGSNFFE